MINSILLQSQKNEILILIEEAGLKPSSFQWVHVGSKYFPNSKVSQLNYTNTDFFYTFDMNGETHYSSFSPATNSYIGTAYPALWTNQKVFFSDWLIKLAKEINEPDLWKNLSSDKSATYNKHSYLATPSNDSPDRATMNVKIDKLLEKSDDSKNRNKNTTGFVIKRYYGKA